MLNKLANIFIVLAIITGIALTILAHETYKVIEQEYYKEQLEMRSSYGAL